MDEKIQEIIKVLESLDDMFYATIEAVSNRLRVKDPFGDLTMTQTQAVFKIGKITPCTLSEAAAALRVSKSAASTLVDRLVNKGVLERKQDSENRRQVLITIPLHAREFLTELDQEIQEEMKKVIVRIGEDQFDAWHAIFQKVGAALTDMFGDGF